MNVHRLLAQFTPKGLLPAALLGLALTFGLGACQGSGARRASAADTDSVRVAQALHQANSRVSPAIGRSVTYDTGGKVLKIVFTTPPDFRIDYSRFWWRWRRNQAAALQVFDAAELEVDVVSIETNHTDGSGRVRARTPAEVVRAYGAAASDDVWRRGSLVEQQSTGKSEWTLVE